ncbi:hypothetical protein H9P43_009830 [Blastocladiella emersonii ATCC 22665]|nr:hypothetical protein H9P43_009830 [Blastocladiella emersonii ATCC 22665]
MTSPVGSPPNGGGASLLALSADPLEDADPERLAAMLHDSQQVTSVLAEENEYLQRKTANQASEAAKLNATVARLEQALFRAQAQIDDLQRDRASLAAAKRSLEKKLDSEVSLLDTERLTWVQREEELAELRKTVRHATSVALNASPPSSQVGDDTQSVVDEAEMGVGDAAAQRMTSAATARDIKAASRALRAQESLIVDLRGEISELSSTLDTANAHNDELKDRVVELSNELIQLEEINKALMEENEAFQMLLSERTVNGDFYLARPLSEYTDEATSPTGTLAGASASSTSLAAEIEAPANAEEVRRLTQENKALTVYIQKILSRIMEHPELQLLLAQDYSADVAAPAIRSSSLTPAAEGSSGKTASSVASRRTTIAGATPESAAKRASKRLSWIPRRVSMFAGGLGLAAGGGSGNGGSTSPGSQRDRSRSPLEGDSVAEDVEGEAAGGDADRDTVLVVDTPTPMPLPSARIR